MATKPLLSPPEIQIIFSAQVKNVKALETAWRQLVRTINADLIRGDVVSIKTHTQLLGLLYCSWAEAIFLKLIHTPRGFDGGLLLQIQQTKNNQGVTAGWLKALELGLMRVVASNSAGDMANIRQTLTELVRTYIEKPSLLRNKMAHGQWITAFNRENTAINNEISGEISSLNVVRLALLKTATQIIFDSIERLIQSPNKHFRSTIWTFLANHNQQLSIQSSRTLEQKIKQLRKKNKEITSLKGRFSQSLSPHTATD